MVLMDAKITGVQNSSILESSNVLRIISVPIPFKSPTEIPTFISSAFFINMLSLYHARFRDVIHANLTIYSTLCLQELLKIWVLLPI